MSTAIIQLDPGDYLSLLKDDTNQDLHLAGQLASLANSTADEGLRAKIITEVKCFELYLSDGHLKPVMEFSNYIRTDINALTTDEISYISSRTIDEHNTFLLARYHHILYLKNKHQQHAVKAIAAYQILSIAYFDELAGGTKCIHDLMEVIRAGHELSTNIRTDQQGEKERIMDWFYRPEQALFYYQCLIELIADSKLFKRVDITGLTTRALLLTDLTADEFDREYYLEICLPLAKKEGYPINDIYRLIAENQWTLYQRELNETGKHTTSSPLKAAIFYKKAGDHEKSNEVLREIEQQKRNVYMDGVIHEFNREIANQELNDFAGRIINSKYAVFLHLATNPHILTTSDSYVPDPENAFLNGILTTAYDININSRFLTEYDLKMRDIFQDVQLHLELNVVYLIYQIKKQMKEKEMDFVKEGLEYFKNSWFGHKLAKPVLGEDPLVYQWFPTLLPGLTQLLQMNMDHRGTKLIAEEQMAFDQLAVKFEGLLRDLCQMAKITTTKIREEQMVAQDINELLKNKELEPHFEKQDLELWLFIFTGSGYNIRNDVAHGFYRDADYNVDKAQLLLLAYIRLAKYTDLVNSARVKPAQGSI